MKFIWSLVMMSPCARTLLFFCASAAPRSFRPWQLAFLCGWSGADVENGLLELLRRGKLTRDEEGGWLCPLGAEGERFAPLPEQGQYGTPFLEYYFRLCEGRSLEAVEGLLQWAESLQTAQHAWALEFAVEEMAAALLRAPVRHYAGDEAARFLELSVRVQSLADFQYRDPRLMRLLLLRARGVAHLVHNDNYVYIINTILDVQNLLYRKESAAPATSARAPRRREDGAASDGLSAEPSALLDAAPYLSMASYLQGNTRLALDHFALVTSPGRPGEHTEGENGAPQGAFATAFAALAAALFGDYPLAVSMLRTSIRRNRTAACPTRSWLRMHLATVYLAAGRPEDALEHLDAALTGSSLRESVQSWVGARIALAHYHILRGNALAAHRLLCRTADRAGKSGYTWRYNSPYFLDILYTFRREGLADIPAYPLEEELKLCLEGGNRMLKAVALRIRGDMLFRQGASLRETLLPLLQSRAFFKIQQLPGEKSKTCAVLAQVYLRNGDRAKALNYAVEAWPCYEQFRHLAVYWSRELLDLMPAPHMTETPGAPIRGDLIDRRFFKALLELNPLEKEFFLADLLKSVAGVFGAERACLFGIGPDGQPAIIKTHHMGYEQIFGKNSAFPLRMVREALEGVPLAAARDALDGEIPPGESGLDYYLFCIPIQCASSRNYALYVDSNELPGGGDLADESFLIQYGELLSVILNKHFAHVDQAEASAGAPVSTAAAFFPSPEEQRAIIYKSEAMRSLLRRVDKAAESCASVLIHGESGVGKELIARRIHEKSGRRGPFVALNLSSLPEELFESEMQGHERGAFTGAFQKKTGLLEMADRGTLFIDEVPDISPRIQVKLLRLLQERSFMRLGSTRLIRSDFRLIVATNRNLFEDMQSGRFRSDLFYRLCVVPVSIPPLRERPEDVEILARYYLDYFARLHGKAVPFLSESDTRRLCAYAWPGNIRELKNVVERAVIFADGGPLPFLFDTDGFGRPPAPSSATPHGPLPQGEPMFPPITTHDPTALPSVVDAIGHVLKGMPTIKELEAQYIATVLRMTGGKVSGRNGAAAILGMTRSTLYEKMRALDINPSRIL